MRTTDFGTEPSRVYSFPNGNLVVQKPEPKFSGALSGPMWNKIEKLNSTYVDTFDWSMYDRLQARFGEEQPRGGVIFKTGLKVVNFHPTCSNCHYSFELDTYGRGCVHDCAYCYAKDKLTVHGYWNKPFPMPIDLSEIRKIFYEVFETDKPSKWRSVLGRRIPLRIGSMSDSFMWMDQKYRVSYELLKILDYYKYPYIVFTRSDLIATDDYIDALNPNLAAIQFSISGDNEQLTRLIEPGAPSVKRRIAALSRLSEAGITTAVRINPLFPTFPDGYFSNQEKVIERFGSIESVPKFNLLDVTNLDPFLGQLSDAKVRSLVVGFVRLKTSMINRVSESAGIDLKAFFDPNVINDGQGRNREKKYSDAEIGMYYSKIREAASRHKLRYTTCYIGNGVKDYYQYQNLWDNKRDCCDVVGKLKSFTATSQNIPWEVRARFAPTPEIAERSRIDAASAEQMYTPVNSKSESGTTSAEI